MYLQSLVVVALAFSHKAFPFGIHCRLASNNMLFHHKVCNSSFHPLQYSFCNNLKPFCTQENKCYTFWFCVWINFRFQLQLVYVLFVCFSWTLLIQCLLRLSYLWNKFVWYDRYTSLQITLIWISFWTCEFQMKKFTMIIKFGWKNDKFSLWNRLQYA